MTHGGHLKVLRVQRHPTVADCKEEKKQKQDKTFNVIE